jgi:AMP-binding enzyme
MDALRCTIEPRAGVDADGLARAVGDAIHRDIGVRAEMALAAPGTLPRYELKARRFSRRQEAETV